MKKATAVKKKKERRRGNENMAQGATPALLIDNLCRLIAIRCGHAGNDACDNNKERNDKSAFPLAFPAFSMWCAFSLAVADLVGAGGLGPDPDAVEASGQEHCATVLALTPDEAAFVDLRVLSGEQGAVKVTVGGQGQQVRTGSTIDPGADHDSDPVGASHRCQAI